MTDPTGATFETARDRTLHWTLSLYVRPEKLWGSEHGEYPAGGRGSATEGEVPVIKGAFQSRRVGEMQLRESVSRALRDAIEPLFNDIADREVQGEASDFLLAVNPDPGAADPVAAARQHVDIVFHPPGEVRWRTEGREFAAAPRGLDAKRAARMRRFWFVHNNGALSWHVGITLPYALSPSGGTLHEAADYLFLSMLQKLAAPKEFALDGDSNGLVFDDKPLGIAPLDELRVAVGSGEPQRFWPLLKSLFDEDAASLLDRLAKAHGYEVVKDGWKNLLEMTSLVEVPGLRMPRCRTMMFFHDERFFARLAPHFDADGSRLPRRKLIRDDCYSPYAERLKQEIARADKDPMKGPVVMGDADQGSFWQFVRDRGGESEHAGCLDYLFLSGFNQNIIDFMNQDPSEILDGTDPIYPANDDQSDEGFFVRFANHRSMITYAPRSRSLEVGNDYIGTCPYSFLIHVLSLHNEFLARDFEGDALGDLEKINQELSRETLCVHHKKDGHRKADYQEIARRINRLKISRYRIFEQFRYINVFRYDTERDVFAELEQLRGVDRKKTALDLALASLEDHTDDLEDQRREQDRDKQARHERRLAAILFVLALLGFGDFLFKVADYLEKYPAFWKLDFETWAPFWDTLALLAYTALFLVAAIVAVINRHAFRGIFRSDA